MHSAESLLNEALDAGVTGYVLKDNAAVDVLASLRTVAAGGIYLSPAMSGRETIARVEVLVVSIPRDVPYLGAPGAGETINPSGYFVRGGNRTVYSAMDRSVLVKVPVFSAKVTPGSSTSA